MAIPEDRRARLDRSDVDVWSLDRDEHAYWRDGFLIKEGLIPDDLTERYWAERIAIDDGGFSAWGGSYMAMPSMQDVCLYAPIVSLVEKLVGEPLAMFLSLSGVQSSQREWHQDFYLKPGYENLWGRPRRCGAWKARLLSPEGLLVAVCHTPSFHDAPDR